MAISEFERRAWEKRTGSDSHPPKRACEMTIDQIENNELINIRHIIVIAVENVDGADMIHTLQAGDMSQLAAEGAMFRAMVVSRDS